MNDVATSTLSLHLSRHFDAPPERVFDAWLGASWGAWLPPGGATCKLGVIDPREGGRFELVMTMPDGREVPISGTYREVARPERLVFSWAGGCNDFATLVTVTFAPDGAGTSMTLRQDGFEEGGLREGFRSGWSGEGGSFDKLAALLAA